LTWWWLIYGGIGVYAIVTLFWLYVMLAIADDWWLTDLALILFWPVILPIMLLVRIVITLWEHR
jgi:hypothetical protein